MVVVAAVVEVQPQVQVVAVAASRNLPGALCLLWMRCVGCRFQLTCDRADLVDGARVAVMAVVAVVGVMDTCMADGARTRTEACGTCTG